MRKGCQLNCKHCHNVNIPFIKKVMMICDLNAFEECIANDYSKHEYYVDDRP